MRLPDLNAVSRGTDYKIEFRGLNLNLFVGEDEFAHMENLCATNYPVMTPRAKRATVNTIASAQGLYARGKLCWCADKKFFYDGVQKAAGLAAGEKIMVGMGAYVIIFPDGIRYNTLTGVADSLAASWAQATSATISLCRLDGQPYNDVTASESAPENPENGDYWLDTSGDVHVLKIYSAGTWQSIPTTYAKVACTGIGSSFSVGDAVEISGGPDEVNGAHEIAAVDTGYIVIPCVLDQAATVASGMAVTRSLPAMDYVCELNNRLWGCSSAKHEIYCCKLGDPTNWNTLGTGAGDAWAATIGSDGDFTGCCAYAGSVLFFKENVLHKVFGSKPSNFQITDTPLRGVQKGCHKSIRQVNETLIYKSRDGVVAYDAGNPQTISDNLGQAQYKNAAAGVQGDRYYISMQDEDGAWNMFVFNEAKGQWHREDATQAKYFAELNGQLYFIRADGKLIAVQGRREAGATLEDEIDWYGETGDIDINTNDNKYLSRVQVRAAVGEGATLKIEAMYDSDGEWHLMYRRGASRKASFTVPMIPMRCDHLRLRISGHGHSAVYAISKTFEGGTEL